MKTAAYPLLHGASVGQALKLQPLVYPELAPQMREWARLACRRQCVAMPQTATPPDVILKAARVLSANRAAKRSGKKGWKSGYKAEHAAQQADITYYLWHGFWPD